MANLIPMWQDGRAICAALADKLRNGTQLDDWETGFVAGALEAAATGGNVRQALKLVRRPGRERKSDRDDWIWNRVDELRGGGILRDEACKIVAIECAKWGEFGGMDRYGAPTRTEAWQDVLTIYKKQQKAVDDARGV